MSDAEEALLALAHDLVEEIAAGRVLELAGAAPAQAPAPQPVEIPKPKTGAAAVHPQLGVRHVTLPGDTMSGHAHAHVPQPFPVKAPDARDQVIADAQQHLAAHHQADAERTEAERAAAEAQRTGIPAPGTYAPLDDEQYGAHAARAQHTVAAELDAGHATDKTETLDGKGRIWSPERAMAHNEIVQQIAARAITVPSEGHAILATGLPGTAKAAALKKAIDPARHALVSADAIKGELARRGMVPESDGLAPAERSALSHAEAGHVQHLAAARLMAGRKNLALDIPGASEAAVEAHRDLLASRGYQVHGVHVSTPADAGAATAGHRSGLEAYRQGKGDGARLMPPDLVRSAETRPGASANDDAFSATRDKLASWQHWDAAGKPKMTEQSGEPQSASIASVEDLIKRSKP